MDQEELEKSQNNMFFDRMMGGIERTEPHILIFPNVRDTAKMAENGIFFPVSAVPDEADTDKFNAFKDDLQTKIFSMMNVTQDKLKASSFSSLVAFPDGSHDSGGVYGVEFNKVGANGAEWAEQATASIVTHAQAVPPACPSAEAAQEHWKNARRQAASLKAG